MLQLARFKSVRETGAALAVAALLAGVAHAHAPATRAAPREIAIEISEEGFVPASIRVRPGRPVVLVMTRTTDQTCATEAVFPKLGKTYPLPLNKPVRVALGPQKRGRIEFACGMNMFRGVVLVR